MADKSHTTYNLRYLYIYFYKITFDTNKTEIDETIDTFGMAFEVNVSTTVFVSFHRLENVYMGN